MSGSAEGEDATGLEVKDSIAVVHVEGEMPAGSVEGTIQDRSVAGAGAGGSSDRDRPLNLAGREFDEVQCRRTTRALGHEELTIGADRRFVVDLAESGRPDHGVAVRCIAGNEHGRLPLQRPALTFSPEVPEADGATRIVDLGRDRAAVQAHERVAGRLDGHRPRAARPGDQFLCATLWVGLQQQDPAFPRHAFLPARRTLDLTPGDHVPDYADGDPGVGNAALGQECPDSSSSRKVRSTLDNGTRSSTAMRRCGRRLPVMSQTSTAPAQLKTSRVPPRAKAAAEPS